MLYFLSIFILILLFLGKILNPSADQIVYGGDLLTQFYFWKGYIAESVRGGVIPFWNPYIFSGTPILAHPASSFFYPVTFLYILFPLNLVFSWNYFIHLLIGALGMYVLSRLYVDKISSIFSSVAFIFSGYFSARIYAGHVDLLTTAVWIPWVFYSFKKALDNPSKRSIFVAVLFLSLEILAGYQAYVIFTLELLFFYFLYRAFTIKPLRFSTIYSRSVFLITIVGFSIFITAIAWLPTLELARQSIRGEGMPYELASWGSLPLSGIKLFWEPLDRTELNKIVFNLGGGPKSNPFDHFVGRVPLLIIFVFIISHGLIWLFLKKLKKYIVVDRDFWFFLSVSLVFLGLSLGNNITPNLHGIAYTFIPFYKFIRIPLQHLIIVVFLVPLVASICLSRVKFPILRLLVVGLVILELWGFGRQYIFLTSLPEKKYDQQLISFLQEKLKGERFLPLYRVTSPLLGQLDLNAPMKYKIETTSGYDPVILRDYYNFIDNINKSSHSSLPLYNVEIPPISGNSDLLKFLNVRYVLAEKGNSFASSSDFLPILQGTNYDLYQIRDALPRFYLTKNAVITSSENLKKLFLKHDVSLNDTIYLEKEDIGNLSLLDLDCKEKQAGTVSLVSYTPNMIVLDTDSICNVMLSTSEVYYPGWKAKIDDKDTEIYRSNTAFRSLYVPKGKHTIKVYYRPTIFYIGGLISLASILGMILFYKRGK